MSLAARGTNKDNRTSPSSSQMFGVRSLAHLLVLPVVATLGCRAQDLRTLPPDVQALALPTHRSVPAPPSRVRFFGCRWRITSAAAPFRSVPRLCSRLSVLIRHRSSFSIAMGLLSPMAKPCASAGDWYRWRPPLPVGRRVIRALASFESAERLAERWRDQGVEAKVAHPDEWEVWALLDAPDLPGVPLRDVTICDCGRGSTRAGGARGWPHVPGTTAGSSPGTALEGRCDAGTFSDCRLMPTAAGPCLSRSLWSATWRAWCLMKSVQGRPRCTAGPGGSGPTWALANSHRFSIDGYHLCSDTQCQVYSDPRQASATVREAIRATSGEVLRWEGRTDPCGVSRHQWRDQCQC